MRTLAIFILMSTALLTGVQTPMAQPIISGFIEGNQAFRIEENTALGDGGFGDRSYPRSELRVQMTVQGFGDTEEYFIRADFISDATSTTRSTVDLREAYIKLRLAGWLDLKAGRQVATWGTGDLVFANDLFAKDWDAFFTGLEDTYLKPPQDLLRATLYVGGVTVDLAVSPYFTPDNLPDGRRLSVYNPFPPQMRTVGYALAPEIHRPARRLENGEFFGRISGYNGGAEWALYGYRGFWPTPQGATRTGVLYYPRMWSVGSSLRMPVGSFLAHAEAALYTSLDDTDGTNPAVANSQLRGFAGLEKSLGNDWTVAAQYVAELMLDYDLHLASLPVGAPVVDELRSTVTGRIGKFLRNQTVYVAVFGYWGVSDEDWHLRPAVSYNVTDAVKWTVGGNLVGGDQPYTTFGQFRDNSNLFTRLRFSF